MKKNQYKTPDIRICEVVNSVIAASPIDLKTGFSDEPISNPEGMNSKIIPYIDNNSDEW